MRSFPGMNSVANGLGAAKSTSGNNTLIISHDLVGKRMAGPGIRYYHLARVLARHVPVTLAVPDYAPVELPETEAASTFRVVQYRTRDWDSLKPLVMQAAVCLLPSDLAGVMPQIGEMDTRVVIDGYDPLLAEWLAHAGELEPKVRHRHWRFLMMNLSRQYQMGDFFICASERQRDWWLGLLQANGRINPATYGDDASLRRLIDVVAYGLPEEPPQSKQPVVKGVWPGIGKTDKVLLWGGGLWSWLDPVTAVQAAAILHRRDPSIKLIFPGTRHPNPILHGMPTRTQDAMDAARELGILDKAVFFGDWVPYELWASLLLESDVALSLHFDTLETRLAFRSRVLEYIWADLPSVASGGDATAELIAEHNLGVIVPCQDVDAVVGAVERLLAEPRAERAARFADAREKLTWEHAAQPLIEFCRDPRPAADKMPFEGQTYHFDNVWEQVRFETEYWRNQVDLYERGRFIRTMKWLKSTQRRWIERLRPNAMRR
jgi:glycosyltransferase involved in cell wall biosynthesis